MQGQYHAETNAALVNAETKETVHPDDHLNHNFALLGGTVLTQLSLKSGFNALYGIMRAALLYYQLFVKDIKSIGFEINPYDPCVTN